MKDKLVKTGKKRRYYVVRKAVIFFAIFTCVSAAIAIPVSVRAYHKTHTALVVR